MYTVLTLQISKACVRMVMDSCIERALVLVNIVTIIIIMHLYMYHNLTHAGCILNVQILYHIGCTSMYKFCIT